MKTFLLTAALGLLLTSGAAAQSKTPPAPAPKADKPLLAVVTTNKADAEVVARSNRLTDRMARQLHLNNYQTNRLRAINQEKVTQMSQIERQYAADPKRVDSDCKGVCQQRDRELRDLLSTAQYSEYFEARDDFYKYDKQFLTEARDATRRRGKAQYAIPGMTEPELKQDADAPVVRPATPGNGG